MQLVFGDKLFGIRFMRGNGLLHHCVDAGLERGDAQRGVLKMRRGNNDRIHLARPDELFAVGKDFQRQVALKRSRVKRTHRNQLAAGDFMI